MSGATPDDSTSDVPENDEPAVDQSTPEPSSGVISARFAGRTAVGLVREHNEDNFVIVDLSAQERCPRDEVDARDVGGRGLLFSVCDGMGGAAAGEVASQMAVDILFEAMTRDPAPADRDDLARRLVSAIEEAGKKIHDGAQAERERRGMGTTSTAAALLDKVLFVGEVGDSRAYLLRGDTMKQITKDQSLVSQLIEAGHLTEEEAEAFEHSNIILQALGTSESVQVDLTFVELRRGDRLMLCSDGLSGLVHDDSIKEALGDIKDPAECAATLIEYAEAGGGHDNITVIVSDFDGDGLPEASESDSFGYMQYPLLPAGTDGAATVAESSSGAGQQAAAATAQDDDVPSPPSAGGGRGWLIAGLLAILVGGYVLSMSAVHQQPEPEVVEPVPAAEPTPEAAEELPVEVRIHTDVEGATLLVNDETHGRLLTDTAKEMKLRPGAYRFEAQSAGVSAAVQVVSVLPEVPLDVYLNLPDGRRAMGDGDVSEDGAGAPEGDAAAPTGDVPAVPAGEAPPAGDGSESAQRGAAVDGVKADDADDAARERRRARRRERAAAAAAAAAAEPKAAAPAAKPKPKLKPKAAEPAEAIPDNPF